MTITSCIHVAANRIIRLSIVYVYYPLYMGIYTLYIVYVYYLFFSIHLLMDIYSGYCE